MRSTMKNDQRFDKLKEILGGGPSGVWDTIPSINAGHYTIENVNIFLVLESPDKKNGCALND